MKNKKLLLLGYGPGNGESIANAFGKEGMKITIAARNESKLKLAVENLRKNNIESDYFVVDFSNEDSLREKLNTYIKDFFPDLVIYNASAFNTGSPLEFNYETLIQDFKVNVGGAFISAQILIPEMKKHNTGKFFITGGGTALKPFKDGFSLSIGKAAVRNFTYSLAQEVASSNIHVATVTIDGMIKKGTSIDPDLIAQEYIKLYNQEKPNWKTEIHFA